MGCSEVLGYFVPVAGQNDALSCFLRGKYLIFNAEDSGALFALMFALCFTLRWGHGRKAMPHFFG